MNFSHLITICAGLFTISLGFSHAESFSTGVQQTEYYLGLSGAYLVIFDLGLNIFIPLLLSVIYLSPIVFFHFLPDIIGYFVSVISKLRKKTEQQ